jgi:hypothetical protein
MQAIITRVATRILMMLNPAGAILQAIEAIYRVIKWVIDNAARIFTLIESVVNGAAQILAGNVSGVANLVESSLVRLMVPVIDFLADYLGLGGIPNAIKNVILGLQSKVEKILDRVIGFVVTKAKALWEALKNRGKGKDKDGKDKDGKDKDGTNTDGSPDHAQIKDGQVGQVQEFTSGDESHRLWAEKTGATYVLMVASTPEELKTLLNSRRIQQLSKREPELQADVATAKQILGLADHAIEQIVTASRTDNAAELDNDDKDLEQQMRQLVPLLRHIMYKVSTSRKPAAIEKLFQEQNRGIQPGNDESRYGASLKAKLQEFGLAIAQHQSGAGSGKDAIDAIRGSDKIWTVHQGAIYAPFVAQHSAAVDDLAQEAVDCDLIMSLERGGTLVQDEVLSGTSTPSQSIPKREGAETHMPADQIAKAVEVGHITAADAAKLAANPTRAYKIAQKADLRNAIDRTMHDNPDRALTIGITETRVSGSSVNFIIGIVNDVLRTGHYPNLRFKILALDQTMHSTVDEGARLAYAPIADANRVEVVLRSTPYILGEDVAFQVSPGAKHPIIVFKGTEQQLTAYWISPQDETISRDIVIDLVDGAYNAFLPGVL